MFDRTESQCDAILRYLQKHGEITTYDAFRKFGCTRLAARISDLRGRGIGITTNIEKKKTKRGDVVSYARYTLEGSERR